MTELVGDWFTDETAALQELLDGNQRVELPPGVYRVSGPLDAGLGEIVGEQGPEVVGEGASDD